MPVTTHGGWGRVEELVLYIKEVDGLTKVSQAKVAKAVAVVYRSKAPGRVAKAVRGRSRTVGPLRTASVTIKRQPMGAPVHGRDVGTQAVAHWTNSGTTGPILRTSREPFYLWGREIPFVAGQKAQGWVDEARTAGAAIGDAEFAALSSQVDVTLRKFP